MTRSRMFLLSGALVLGFFLVGSVVALRFSAVPGASLEAEGQARSVGDFGTGAPQSLTLGAADRLKVSGSWKVRLVPGVEGQAVLTARETPTFRVSVRNEGGTLHLETKGNGQGQAILEVSLPRLKAIEASGASEFDLPGLATDGFTVSVSGACSLVASGAVGRLDLQSSGATSVDLSGATATSVSVQSSGAGNLRLRCDGPVDGDISGAVNLSVAGTPEIRVRSSGTSSVHSGP